ncbi:MAG: type II toxin-antitoxin system YafQ family toxin [Clostridiales bacterium]|nr:type II toxin-antitoxin system YafQ family toxin [Clostridiales bacterium]
MHYKIEQSAEFKRQLKLLRKRGYDMSKLEAVVSLLQMGQPLPLKNRDHSLTGNFVGFRECHIAPDWLLIYSKREDVLILCLFQTGTHSDLF